MGIKEKGHPVRLMIAVVVIATVFLLFGWMSISSDSSSTSVRIETQKVVNDTEQFVEAAAEKIDAATADVQDAIEVDGSGLGNEDGSDKSDPPKSEPQKTSTD